MDSQFKSLNVQALLILKKIKSIGRHINNLIKSLVCIMPVNCKCPVKHSLYSKQNIEL